MSAASQFFSGREPGRAVNGVLGNEERPVGGLTLADLDGDGDSELVAADRRGFLHAMRVVNDGFGPAWQAEVECRSRSVRSWSHQPIQWSRSMSTATTPTTSSSPRPKGYGLLSGRTGLSLWEPDQRYPVEYAHPADVRSPPGVFYGREEGPQRALAIFCEDRGLMVLDLRERKLVRQAPLPRAAMTTPIAGPLLGDGRTLAFVRTDLDGAATMFDLKDDVLPRHRPMAWLPRRADADRQGISPVPASSVRLRRRRSAVVSPST